MAKEKTSGFITDTAKKNCSPGFKCPEETAENVKKVNGSNSTMTTPTRFRELPNLLERSWMLSEHQKRLKKLKIKQSRSWLPNFVKISTAQ